MRRAILTGGVMLTGVMLICAGSVWAEDWPQWRGLHRDNKVTGFSAPTTWPEKLTQKWKVPVGLGDSSPVLVGDKVYVFTREGGDEVIRCLEADSGKEVWKEKYAAKPVTNRAAGGHPGPRSTPAVAEGKVCTLGVSGDLYCCDAATGKVAWKKNTNAWPMFSTSSSPIIVDGKCIVFLGKEDRGDLGAFDLATGDEKWKWTDEGPSYGSPVLMTVDGTKQIVTLSQRSLIGINATDGKLLWKVGFTSRYNSCTPVIDGQTVILSTQGAGTVAFKVEKEGDKFAAKQLWKKTQASGIYNTPVLKDGALYGLSAAGGRGMGGGAGSFYCLSAETGDTLWTDNGKRGDCGEIFDAGSVLLALTSDMNLVAFKPNKKQYEEVAKIKVADTPTWAYPIISGNRIFVKDKDNLALLTLP